MSESVGSPSCHGLEHLGCRYRYLQYPGGLRVSADSPSDDAGSTHEKSLRRGSQAQEHRLVGWKVASASCGAGVSDRVHPPVSLQQVYLLTLVLDPSLQLIFLLDTCPLSISAAAIPPPLHPSFIHLVGRRSKVYSLFPFSGYVQRRRTTRTRDIDLELPRDRRRRSRARRVVSRRLGYGVHQRCDRAMRFRD